MEKAWRECSLRASLSRELHDLTINFGPLNASTFDQMQHIATSHYESGDK